MDDREIIELYWARDEAAIEETNSRYGTRLGAMAYRILQNQSDVEEVLNDTWLRLWNLIPPNRPVYFFAYMAKICRNLSLGRVEFNQASKRSARIVELTAEMEECIPDTCREAEWESRELGRLLSSFLRTLSRENQRIFVLKYWYFYSVDEISKELRLGKSVVTTRLYRMRGQLKKYLEREGIHV